MTTRAHTDVRHHLTPTEQRLWDVLRAQPGRVFTRAELVEHVMGGTVVLQRTIDVHVKSIRQKLGPRAERLRTVRNAGYCYIDPPSGKPSRGA